jgi:hypothetical protein
MGYSFLVATDLRKIPQNHHYESWNRGEVSLVMRGGPKVWLAGGALVAIAFLAAFLTDRFRGDAEPRVTISAPPPTTAPSGTQAGAPLQPPATQRLAWSIEKTMNAIDGTLLVLGKRAVRVDAATTLCSGVGRRLTKSGVRRWSSFDCTYTTFSDDGIDRDVDFHVILLGPKRYAIRGAHWVGNHR